jgi:nucleotide-binding universal stress UspA family protein
MMKRIVVGVDGSEGAAQALQWAIGLAAEEGAEIIAVHAFGPMEGFGRGAANAVFTGLGLPPSGLSSIRYALRRQLEEDWCAPLRSSSLPFRTCLEKASSASAGLMSVADRENADLIVVGAHDHGGFEDRVLGSVSYTVSHRAHQPVVIVPPDVGRLSA